MVGAVRCLCPLVERDRDECPVFPHRVGFQQFPDLEVPLVLIGVVGVGHVGVFVSEHVGTDELTGLVVRLEQQASDDALYFGLAILLPLVGQVLDLLHLAALDLHAKHRAVHG